MNPFKAFKKKFRNIKKFPGWVFLPAVILIKTLKLCMRKKIVDPNKYINTDTPLVSVTWHNRLLFFPAMFPFKTRKRTVAIVSPSRDGQYVTDIVSFFGIKSLRGSSFKRGCPVLLEAKDSIKKGFNVSFTPDGSRGPRYKMSKGPVFLASLTGAPVVPVSINASSYWELKTWDKFQIPKPWAKLTLVMGNGITVPPDLDEEGLEKWRAIVEERLMAITEDKKD